MTRVGQTTDPARTRRVRALTGLGLPIIGMALVLLAPTLTALEEDFLPPQSAFDVHRKQIELSLIRQEKQEFLQQQVDPLLQATVQKNQQAIVRARQTLTNAIDRYKLGIEPFIRDLRSWSTEYGIVTRSIVGWWRQDDRFDRFMAKKFSAHLFTDTSIAADVANVRQQLVEDIQANQNQLLVELTNASAAVKMKLPPVWPDSAAFGSQVSAQARAVVGRGAVMYEVGSDATVILLPAIVDMATRAIASAAATRAGGAVLAEVGTLAAGAGDGGAAGSELPGVGNLIGFGVGLFVSALAVNYEEARADESIRQNIGDYIETLKTGIVGGADTPSEIMRGMTDYVVQVDEAEQRIVAQDAMATSDEVMK